MGRITWDKSREDTKAMDAVTGLSRLRVTDSPQDLPTPTSRPRPPPPEYHEAVGGLHRAPPPPADTGLQKYASETCLLGGGGGGTGGAAEGGRRGRSQSNAALLRSPPRDIPATRRPALDCPPRLEAFLPYHKAPPSTGCRGRRALPPHPHPGHARAAPSQPGLPPPGHAAPRPKPTTGQPAGTPRPA
ncbi:hypothetical protein O3P69_018697 [Scylla paramamosain]|uniref:Uncharacterized protein n=1 Tax=Scylla paramamosain TaxID=85552 RepID=A0AAW0SRD3_SCYPA